MQADRIAELLQQLSPEQRNDYEQLLTDLANNGGDLSKLSADQQQRLSQLASAMNPETGSGTDEAGQQPEEPTAELTVSEETNVSGQVPQISPSSTPFGMYVVEQLKVLCEGGSSLADAVRYAYHNKYLPVALRDPAVCVQVYQRHQLEIDALTDSMQAVDRSQQREPRVLVGLAWFSILYQCYQYVEAYGDLH